MDELRIHPPPVTAEDLGRLLAAAREALALLERMEAHAPEDPAFGSEGRVRKTLREAVRRCSYEVRSCGACDGGTVGVSASPTERPTPAPCPECGGRGAVRVLAYPRPKARRGR